MTAADNMTIFRSKLKISREFETGEEDEEGCIGNEVRKLLDTNPSDITYSRVAGAEISGTNGCLEYSQIIIRNSTSHACKNALKAAGR